MNELNFTFSDLVAGYVVSADRDQNQFVLKTSDDREFRVRMTPTVFAELVRNLNEAYQDATGQAWDMLVPGRYLYVYGVFYPEQQTTFEAKHIVFLGRTENEYRFESQDWWVKQIKQLADFYLDAEFPGDEVDYRNYRTNLSSTGDKQKSGRQETDTISRLVYGFASAYMLTGDDRYLEAAEKGTEYLREHMRFSDKSEGTCYWYHAIDVKADGTEQKVFASEFGDDYQAIPCYEQIYALAGPTQTYRITGDNAILEDAKATIRLFNRHFKDASPKGGYYSHIDPITLSPHAESLGKNRSKKNWNSVGDHAPAYLINLFLATGNPEYADFLETTFDTISAHFPDYQASPFVQERFFDDWSKDQSWGWQQNRAVVGHNLKIAWNLTRMNSLRGKDEYVNLAKQIAEVMPAAGSDRQRGGWYDVVERVLEPGQNFHRFVWHDRKAWWQQEQAILAYLILTGALKDEKYRKHAREAASFYNAWFLDTECGGVYFNVLANGQPYALGTERGKGSHSMAGYHSFELCYLAAAYTNLLITKEPLELYFKPKQGGFPDNVLRVAPDLLPAGSVRIGSVWINGQEHRDFDAEALTVKLPADAAEMKVRVRLEPAEVALDADLLEVDGGVAKIALAGEFEPRVTRIVEEQVDAALAQHATSFVFVANDLKTISSEAIRYLVFTKQRLGSDVQMSLVGTNDAVRQAIEASEFNEEIALA
ncbi:MAG: AGE family epimerase/isomerase [Pirellulales bacterium]|nr:AGE family epimerase/isomerase [Pirellulales bacterium]